MNNQSISHSTNYNSRFATNTLVETYTLEYEDGELEQRLDLGDWEFISIIKRLKNSTPYLYNGVEKFTTIVYRVYGNTTVYRIILAFNGFAHPYEILRGTIIRLPLRRDVEALVAQYSNSNNDLFTPGTIIEVQKAR